MTGNHSFSCPPLPKRIVAHAAIQTDDAIHPAGKGFVMGSDDQSLASGKLQKTVGNERCRFLIKMSGRFISQENICTGIDSRTGKRQPQGLAPEMPAPFSPIRLLPVTPRT